MGKPITQSRTEVDTAIHKTKVLIEQSNGAFDENSDGYFDEDIIMNKNGITKKIILEPIGLVLALLPYDFPVLEAILRLVPAVLAGNSVLLKSSKDTPMLADMICSAFDDVAPGLV